MDPKLKDALTQFLTQSLSLLQSGVDFAKQQIPQILWEKVALDRIYMTAWFLVGLLGLWWGFLWITKKFEVIQQEYNKTHWQVRGHLCAKLILGWISASLGLMAFVGGCVANSYELATVWFAPRLYLLNWIKDLIHPSGS